MKKDLVVNIRNKIVKVEFSYSYFLITSLA